MNDIGSELPPSQVTIDLPQSTAIEPLRPQEPPQPQMTIEEILNHPEYTNNPYVQKLREMDEAQLNVEMELSLAAMFRSLLSIEGLKNAQEVDTGIFQYPGLIELVAREKKITLKPRTPGGSQK